MESSRLQERGKPQKTEKGKSGRSQKKGVGRLKLRKQPRNSEGTGGEGDNVAGGKSDSGMTSPTSSYPRFSKDLTRGEEEREGRR